jgi:hypothetical protein
MKQQMFWSDAWFLLATIYAGQQKWASLADVIAAADYINHAVLVFEEVEGALARLSSEGYITFSNGQLAPTEKTITFYRSVTKPRRTVLNELKDLEKFIGSIKWDPKSKPQQANEGVSFPELSRSEFDSAVLAYVGCHSKAVK